MYYSNFSQMAFKLSNQQESFLKRVDNICKIIRSYEEQCYLEEKFNDKVIPEFAKIGMLGCPISRKYGGLGYDILTYALAIERIGQEGSSLRTFFSAHTSLGQMALQSWATDEQKKEYLLKTTNGTSIMAFALTEPEAGSDPSSMTTKFENKDNENYVLNGKKHWIGNGTFADVIIVFAKESNTNDSNSSIYGKVSAFIVDKNSCLGLQVQEIKNKIGLLTVKNAEICFENCIVPKKNLLGLKGKGLSVAYSSLIDGRLSVAAGGLGVMQDCLEQSIVYSKSRQQHDSVLAKKQLVQEHIAIMAANIESSKWLTYRAAEARQELHDYVEYVKSIENSWQAKLSSSNEEYLLLRKEADRLAAIAKFYVTNAAFDTSNRAVQIFGAQGYRKTNRVARHFLDSRATTIYEGTNEILELKIASMILGKNYKAYR
jgi:alkylation response protein AidB-like acyl-CoA dehydrogenase